MAQTLTVGTGGFNTIQDAINAASNGDTIVVAAGNYDLSTPLLIDKSLTFVGANGGIAGTSVRGAESVLTGGAINIFELADSALTVSFDGFKIVANIVMDEGGPGQDFTLRNSVLEIGDANQPNVFYFGYSPDYEFTFADNLVDVTGYTEFFDLFSGGEIAITDNTFRGHEGVYRGDDNDVPLIVNVSDGSGKVTGNTFDNIDIGVLVANAAGPLLIDDNIFSNLRRDGAETSGGNAAGVVFFIPGPYADTITITNNQFSNSDAGVRTSNVPNTTLEGSTIVVDDNSFSNVDDPYLDGIGGSFTPMNSTLFVGNGGYSTIQAAIDAASEGDTIVVAAGTYAENLVVDVANLTIKGANAEINPNTGMRGAESIIVPGTNNPTDGNVITIRANGVTIDGFTIDADNPALAGGVAMPNGADSNAARGISTGTDGGGFGNISNLLVTNNVIENAQKFGIVLNSSNGVATGGNVITENLIQDIAGSNTTGGLRYGVYMLANTYADVTDNVLKNVGFGIATTNFYNANPDGTSALISGNQITGQVGLFINLHYSGASRFDLLDNELIAGTVLSSPTARTQGARIWSIDNGAKLVIEDNDISGFADGYRLWNNTGSAFTIEGGTLNGNQYGVNARDVDFSETTSPNTYILDGINFASSTIAHIRVVDVAPPTGNNIVTVRLDGDTPPTFGTAPLDVDIAGTDSRFDANGFDGGLDIAGDTVANTLSGGDGGDMISGNAGKDSITGGGGNDALNGGGDTDTASYAGPASGYAVSGTKDASGRFTSFSSVKDINAANGDEGTDSLTGIELLSFNGVVLNAAQKVQLFDANGNLVGTFDTIEAAENAASNDFTIRLAAGDYDEDVTIDVGVTILGAQAGTSATGRDPASGAGASNILGNITVNAAQGVTIDGVRVVNDVAGGNSVSFLSGGGAEGNVLRNSVIYSTVQGGNQGDFAIFTATLASGSITLDDNYVSGAFTGQFATASFQSGLFFNGGGVALIVSDNKFEFTRTGLNLDMNGASTANVTGNLFRAVGSAIAVGVDADGLTVKDNDVENVGTDFSFRNLTSAVTFDAGLAVDALTLANAQNDAIAILGGSGGDTLTGTEFADFIDGNNSPTAPNAADADTINGLGGNDGLFGRGGDDKITGGTGNDTLDGGAGSDTAFFAGPRSGYTITRTTTNGVETISVNDIDASNGDDGRDSLVNFEFLNFGGQVFAAGQAGPDAVNDTNTVFEDGVESASGNVLTNDTDPNGDSLTVTSVSAQGGSAAAPGATVQGKYGTLTLNANGTYSYTADSDLLDTLPGDASDVFSYSISDGQGGTDTATLTIVIDERGDNTVRNSGSGNDTLNGDQPPGGPGSDDTINGGAGNDTINGFDGADTLNGQSGNDTINGGNGRDRLFGEGGIDTIDGGAGDDFIDGGSGNDRMTGGSGADDFFFRSGNGLDTITDFERGSDQLVLEGLTIRSLTERDVDGNRTIDTIVTFSGGGGTVTLLNVSGATAAELQNPNSAAPMGPSGPTGQTGQSAMLMHDLFLL